MGISNTLRKMFGGAEIRTDEYGNEIERKTIEEQLLESHLKRERKKKIRAALQYYDQKHYKEMTDFSMPYHKYKSNLRRKR